MVSLFEKKFEFTWQIQNFSMCPSKFEERMDSPVFTVESMENSEWQILTYPKGDRTENVLSCYLSCESVAGKSDGFKIQFVFAIFYGGNERKSLGTNVTVFKKKGDYFGFTSWISREDIIGGKEAHLPDDTLTIKCYIMQSCDDDQNKKKSFAVSPKNSMLSFPTALDYNYESGKLDECSVVTRVEVHSRNVFWFLPNFISMEFNKRFIIRVSSALKDQPSFIIAFYKSFNDSNGISAEIEIGRTKTDLPKPLFVKCKISVLQAIDIYAEDEHFFDSNIDHIWKFPSFLTLHKLAVDPNLGCNNLHLLIEISFSMPGQVHHMEKVLSHQYGVLTSLPDTVKGFRDMYEGEELPDVTIRAGDREFKVHKTILNARSPVFRTMFDIDMKEKKTGVVDITDVAPDIVDKMLAFMYTNAMDDVQSEDALKLYTMADIYEVQPLKFHCTSVLASKLSVSNVCKVLTLADLHRDEYLRDCAEKFVRMNLIGVLKSAEWKDLMKNNWVLASKIMFKI